MTRPATSGPASSAAITHIVGAATLAGFETTFGLRNVMMAGYGLAEATLSVTCTRRGEPIDTDERGLV
ncbi:MAG: hypothetical protein ACLQFR_26895 [Streptosporangiaceae bacterium]